MIGWCIVRPCDRFFDSKKNGGKGPIAPGEPEREVTMWLADPLLHAGGRYEGNKSMGFGSVSVGLQLDPPLDAGPGGGVQMRFEGKALF